MALSIALSADLNQCFFDSLAVQGEVA